jgi:hypothetical protein
MATRDIVLCEADDQQAAITRARNPQGRRERDDYADCTGVEIASRGNGAIRVIPK